MAVNRSQASLTGCLALSEREFSMGQQEKDQLVKAICCVIGAIIAYHILMSLLPFIEMCLAVIGAAFIYYEYQKGRRR